MNFNNDSDDNDYDKEILEEMHAQGRSVSYTMMSGIDVGGHRIAHAYELETIKDDSQSAGSVISLCVIDMCYRGTLSACVRRLNQHNYIARTKRSPRLTDNMIFKRTLLKCLLTLWRDEKFTQL